MQKQLMTTDRIETKILLLRGQKVVLDRDLAALYGDQGFEAGREAKC